MPFTIRWMDETYFTALPTAAYGSTLAMASLGYILLEWTIVTCNGSTSALARAIGSDRKGTLSPPLLYAAAVPLAFVRPWVAITLYVVIALM